MMLGPLSAMAQRYRIPSWLSALVVVLLVLVLVNATLVLLSAPVIEWIGRAAEIEQILRDKFAFLERPLAALRDVRKAVMSQAGEGAALKVDTGGPDLIAPALAIVTPAIGQLLLFFGTLFFVLWGRSELRRSLVGYFDDRETRLQILRILNDIEEDLTGYLSVVAIIYLCVGVLTGIGAYWIGLPNAAVWGVLAFVLNFIPYIGPLLMVVVLLAIGLITFPSLGHALVAPLLYVALTTIEGHFVTPSIMGRRLTLNPLTVFLALAFWTWLWGPIGAFLAVPLLIAALAALHHLRPKDEVRLPG
jgi:predicted PurR-regulated permease PerM